MSSNPRFVALKMGISFTLLLLAACAGPPSATTPEASLTAQEAQAIAKEAYLFGFPMIVGYKTMNAYAIDESNPEYKGPFNHFGCDARLFTPQDKAVVTPNADTPYCMFWGDLRSEPLVITVPEVEPERFYHFQLIDLYTHNFGYVGTLSTGNEAGSFLIAGPGWQGELPEGVDEVLHSETPFLFSVVRTQLFDSDDLSRVQEIQESYRFEPLSAFLGQEPPAPPSELDFQAWNEGDQLTLAGLSYVDFMLDLVEPVPAEQELFARFATIGLGTDEPFDAQAFGPEVAEAMEAGIREGFAAIEALIAESGSDPLASAKMFGTREFLEKSAKENYGHSDAYLIRAVAAHMGLYGNSGVEATYPTYLVDSEGMPLDATQNAYRITFAEGQLPPVKAFWSLTMYDGATQLFIENPLDRYLLNSSMLEQFQRADDGSLVLYIQKDSPGADLEDNWLPAPDGPFYMVMRLYGPEDAALTGTWTPPAAKKVD